MKDSRLESIKAIIEQIESIDNMLASFNFKEEAMKRMIFTQMEAKKAQFVKELLVELIHSELDMSQYENLYQKIFLYLKQAKTVRSPKVITEFSKEITKAESLVESLPSR